MGKKEKENVKSTIYVTKNGINLTDGLYIVKNRTGNNTNIVLIDTKENIASLFVVNKKIRIQDMMKAEGLGELEVVANIKIQDLNK